MRLDKYLKVTRLIKRRTVANEACDAGRVTVNGSLPQVGQKVTEADIVMLDDIQIKIGKNTGKQLSLIHI